ncbi:hypothetical protein [Streptomyces purpureus]|uniref:Uncharacterized protein n=1 Tax=Streptomyces purpureus TaxID=1951 RepID=A0A918LMW2_9ACTN|nr:hypothetical protein [Streptomyces purpureus]GGT27448.1 hypothetical protein GCM10014713_20920 [Streptomyces purpureus]
MSGSERSLRAVNPALASALYDPESMKDFKGRIDRLLQGLRESPASPDKVGTDRVERTQFGGGGGAWAEASGLFTAYGNVITQLEKLSQLLADCMEGMGIAVVASKDGFENLDDDIRRRMMAINARTEKHYDPKRDPVAREKAEKEAEKQGQPATPPQGGDTAGGNGGLDE